MPAITEHFFIETRIFVRKRFGEDGWRELLELLSEPTREIFRRKLHHKNYSDFSFIAETLTAVKTAFQEREPDVIYIMGKHNAEVNLNLTERILMRLITIKMVLRIASFLWGKRVRDGGSIEIKNLSSRSVRAWVRAFPVAQWEWFEYLRGWFARTIELSGGKDVNSVLVRAAEEDYGDSEYTLSWL